MICVFRINIAYKMYREINGKSVVVRKYKNTAEKPIKQVAQFTLKL
jgi:hypothetical protein